MKIDRRRLLFATAAVAATATQSEQAQQRGRRVSQQELDEAIRLHGKWLADVNSGQRCTFAGKDLSGLQFGALGGVPINLSGADFAQADLSGTEADDLLVHHCNFNGARLDGSRWRQPVFAFADMRRASAVRVTWGDSGRPGISKCFPADFRHTVLNDADLADARICGYFYGTKLVGTSLIRADLSQSEFLGPTNHEMTFSGAQLADAKLRHCRISSVSFYHADCSRVDFSRTLFSDVQMKGCNLTHACIRGAKFERTIFPSDQISQSDLDEMC